MSKVNIDKLADEVMHTLHAYQDVTQEILDEAVNSTAKKTVAKLKQTSPSRSGTYAKSWASKKDTTLSGRWKSSRVVYVKDPHYRLAHLLEKGHALVRGGRKVGSSPAITHIAPAEEFAAEMLMDEIVSRIERNTGV